MSDSAQHKINLKDWEATDLPCLSKSLDISSNTYFSSGDILLPMLPTAPLQNSKGLVLAKLLLPFNSPSVPWAPCWTPAMWIVFPHTGHHLQQLRETEHAVQAKQSQFITLTTSIYSSLTSAENFVLGPPRPCSLSNTIFLVIKSKISRLLHPFVSVMSLSTSSLTREVRCDVFTSGSCLEILSLL